MKYHIEFSFPPLVDFVPQEHQTSTWAWDDAQKQQVERKKRQSESPRLQTKPKRTTHTRYDASLLQAIDANRLQKLGLIAGIRW